MADGGYHHGQHIARGPEEIVGLEVAQVSFAAVPHHEMDGARGIRVSPACAVSNIFCILAATGAATRVTGTVTASMSAGRGSLDIPASSEAVSRWMLATAFFT